MTKLQPQSRKVTLLVLLPTLVAGVILPISMFLVSSSALAFTGGIPEGAAAARGSDQPATLFGDMGIFSQITNVMLFIVGAISVIMIIVGGLRYVISGGESSKITAAKNTILYAIVGIIVSILAFAAVNFVIGSFAENGGGEAGGFSSGNSSNATNF